MKSIAVALLAIAALLGVAALVFLGRGPSVPAGMSRTTAHDFGDIVQGEVVEHTFILANEEPTELWINEVRPSRSEIIGVDSLIPPGGEGHVRVRFDTRSSDFAGAVREPIRVGFASREGEEELLSVWLQLRGRVLRPVHIEPGDRVYFFTVKGREAQEKVEVINYQDEPLEIDDVISTNPLFTPQLREAEKGRRYELTISLDPTAPVGRHEGAVTLSTDSPNHPSLEIKTLARIEDVVSTSVSEVRFGLFNFDALDMEAVSRRTILVEKHEGTGFEVLRASTDLPFLEVEIERREAGQSFFVLVTIDKGRAERGPFAGTLVIETNDPDFPRIELPITGEGV